jgi:hypothetical protein
MAGLGTSRSGHAKQERACGSADILADILSESTVDEHQIRSLHEIKKRATREKYATAGTLVGSVRMMYVT